MSTHVKEYFSEELRSLRSLPVEVWEWGMGHLGPIQGVLRLKSGIVVPVPAAILDEGRRRELQINAMHVSVEERFSNSWVAYPAVVPVLRHLISKLSQIPFKSPQVLLGDTVLCWG